MASVGVLKREFEITDQSLIDDTEIRKAIIYDVPNGFVEKFVLRKPGEFCVSRALNGQFYLSIFVDYNKNTKEEAHTVHLRIECEKYRREISIDGMLFARAKTLGRLVHELANQNMVEILAGVLEKDIKMEHLVGISATKIDNVFVTKEVTNKNILAQNYNSVIYTGRIELADGKIREVLLEESRNFEKKDTFLTNFYAQLVVDTEFQADRLPVRLPIGAILEPPTLIFNSKEKELGFSLDAILKNFEKQLDLTQRIKLCSSAVRIMSELHHADIFHGAVKPENFFAECVGVKNNVKQYELKFNGANGLLIHGKSNATVKMVDYDLNAPELAFTRKLTKESGVFNMGRLFEQILKVEIMKTYGRKLEDEPRALHEMRNLISRATRANPQQRPTMHGVVMIIREVLRMLPTSTTTINFVHFDQFIDCD